MKLDKLKVLELFGGIRACSKALEYLGIEYECVDYVEIDKYAVASANAIYGTNFEPQDICNWDKNIVVDLIMHGSPCQDFSIAGKQAGGDEGSGTRSSLMYETLRIVEKLKPKYVVWENVKNVLSAKHKYNFDAYLERMEQLGYKNFYKVLNAKNYGIPQNRERVFVVSVKSNLTKLFPYEFYFKFPEPIELKLRLKDLLEEEVEEKYYIKKCLNIKETKNYIQWSNSGKMQNSQAERAYYVDNECMCTLSSSNNNGDKTQIVLANKPICLNSKGGRNGIEGLQPSLKDRVYDNTGIATCVATSNFFMPNYTTNDLKIRKLTPKECWRLMGFEDEDFEKAAKVNSNTQLYKQAGNSIVVNVLVEIFRELLFYRLPIASDDVAA